MTTQAPLLQWQVLKWTQPAPWQGTIRKASYTLYQGRDYKLPLLPVVQNLITKGYLVAVGEPYTPGAKQPKFTTKAKAKPNPDPKPITDGGAN